MNIVNQVAELQKYIDTCGEDAFLFGKIKASDILDRLLELDQIHKNLDEFEDALRDIFNRVKETGVEE